MLHQSWSFPGALNFQVEFETNSRVTKEANENKPQNKMVLPRGFELLIRSVWSILRGNWSGRFLPVWSPAEIR